MESAYWHQKWKNNDIRFHEDAPNPLLVQHLPALSLKSGSRIFVPLCGKTRDISWLLSQGHRVVGAELSEIAVEQLFAEMQLTPVVAASESFKHYSAEDLDIYVGDVFELTSEIIGDVQAVYDRAAMVALPEAMRINYSRHLMQVTHNAPQLVICFEYDQSLLQGPPFAIFPDEISHHYTEHYSMTELERKVLEGGLKGKCDALEVVWMLSRRQA